MGSIGWYIFRTTMVAFLITLITLTVVIWFTQAMRDFDLITSERQTLFVFIGITGMIVPLLVMIIAPIALMISASHVLNRLGADSEIIVMNAAGVSPWRLLWPFLAAAILVSVLVSAIAAYISPPRLRELRDWCEQVRADILTNIVQPGRFTSVSGNLTFHIDDRRPNGLLVGIFVDDRRDPKEQATYLAEQGEIVKNDQGSFLVLEHGSIQRLDAGHPDPRIVTFDRDAFDLSKFAGGPQNIELHGARKVHLGADVAAAGRCALRRAAGPVPLGTVRSPGNSALSAGIRHLDLHVPRAAPDHAAEPHAGAARLDRHRHGAAPASASSVSSSACASPAFWRCNSSCSPARSPLACWQISRGRTVEHATCVTRIVGAIGEKHRASGGKLRNDSMVTGTLPRYFAMRFFSSVLGTFVGVVVLAGMIDYFELMRRGADWPKATPWILAKISILPRSAAHRAHHAVCRAGRARCRAI